jgi:hypothetical protein
VRKDDADAGHGEQQRRHLERLHALAGEAGRKPDGEEDLHLHDKRGEPRRDVGPHGDVEEAELPGADQHPVGGEVHPRHRRSLEEEHRRQQRQGEAERREEQRRQVVEAEADDDEVRPPHGHDGEGQEAVAQTERLCRHVSRASGPAGSPRP